jgi:hypothetical protein
LKQWVGIEKGLHTATGRAIAPILAMQSADQGISLSLPIDDDTRGIC